MEKDNTKYLFDDKKLGKGKLVLAVIKKYIIDHRPSYKDLYHIFPDKLQGSTGCLIDDEGYQNKLSKTEDTANRYYTNDKLALNDGETVYVSNQWGIANIDGFINKATELGYLIETLGSGKSTSNKILQLFSKHEQDPPTNWINSYRERCQEISSYRNKEAEDYSREFLEDVWLKPSNGIANVSPGFLSNLEFDNLYSELPKMTSQILSNPSAEMLDTVIDWAKQSKKSNKFTSIKWGVINRVFAGANPDKYTTVLDHSKTKSFMSALNKRFKLNMSLIGNWTKLNESLINEIRSQGLDDKDIFLFNTFLWKLYEYVVEGKNVFNETIKESNNIKLGNGINRIYYGPPGTGKTYNTINGALEILDNNFYLENISNRANLKLKFDEYVKEGRIGFVTFHQSFSYEDFVEGLRAEADDDGNIQYFVQEGIFKQLCEKASKTDTSTGIDEAIRQFIEQIEDKPLHLQTTRGKGFTVNYRGGRTFRIKPDSSDKSSDYPASIENIKKVYRGVSLKEIYNHSYVSSILAYLKSDFGLSEKPITETTSKPVVLIVDEINRGNTANIFGELITLIEPSKRLGAEEALSVVLPYSKEPFGVPSNLHIIGTMNTADRSLALIDTALRRRFQFIEMLPKPELLSDVFIDGVDVKQLLTVMNKRISLLYDREHTLGHSFFLSLNENSTLSDLRSIFEGQILPLLEEYFFEDWEKIRQVLGDHQKPKDLQLIKPEIDDEEVTLLLGDNNNNMLNSLYSRDDTALSNPKAYITIYEKEID